MLCTDFIGVELGPEDVSILKRCPYWEHSLSEVHLLIPFPQEDGSGKVVQFTQTPLSFQLSAKTVPFGKNVTVSWDIPQDEATHQDWIGGESALFDNADSVRFEFV